MRLYHLPNLLTLFRIAMVPVLMLVYYLPGGYIIATGIFFIACVTDWLDGYLARKMKSSSPIGVFLDPVADKLIVVVALVVVVGSVPYVSVAAIIIIGREIVVSALREWMAEIGQRTSVAVTYISKIKTMLQMIAIGFLLASNHGHYSWIMVCAYLLIYLAAILTLWTMIVYLRVSWKYLA